MADLDSLDVLEQFVATSRPSSPSADGEGPVLVRLDHRGQVSEVRISDRWRDHLTAGELQSALLDAYRAAALAPRETKRPVPPLPDEPGDLDGRAWFDDVRRRLDRTEETLAQAERQLAEVPAGRVVSGPAGVVRLILRGSTVTQVAINPREAAHRIAADALAAFSARSPTTARWWAEPPCSGSSISSTAPGKASRPSSTGPSTSWTTQRRSSP